MDEDIQIRVESMRNALEKLNENVTNKLEEQKKTLLSDLNQFYEKKSKLIANYQKFADDVLKKRTITADDTRKIEEYSDEIKEMDKIYNRMLGRVCVKISDWQPNPLVICQFIKQHCALDVMKLREINPKILSLPGNKILFKI